MAKTYTKLRGRMTERSVTQAQLAEQIGIKLTAMNQRLSGKSEFKASEILKACEVLDIHPDEVWSYFFAV